ncbi:MAG: phosphoglycerate mutase family protein [Chloroflexota bacterium]|nr:phosphoglycerate mutase family protein [Chloroflexota bacterium]
MSRSLIFVKHSMPALEPGIPSREWRLSDEGRARCMPLAEHLTVYQPMVIAASAESKATETARIVAALLAAPIEIVADLHENDRTGLGWLDADELEQRIARFFAEPDRRIMGNETADEADARFAAAVAAVCARHPHGNIVIVAHGTVITLFVTRRAGREPFPFWKRLGLPSFVALSLPDFGVRAINDRIESA